MGALDKLCGGYTKKFVQHSGSNKILYNLYDTTTVQDEVIMSKIYFIRDKKVMIDSVLAELYEVETKQLKRAVRRNIKRFPDDFMFELTENEFTNLRRDRKSVV